MRFPAYIVWPSILNNLKPHQKPARAVKNNCIQENLVRRLAFDPAETDVFVDDSYVTTDKKLRLERLQVAVAAKQF